MSACRSLRLKVRHKRTDVGSRIPVGLPLFPVLIRATSPIMSTRKKYQWKSRLKTGRGTSRLKTHFFFKGDEPRTTYLVLRGSQRPVSCVGAKGEHGGRVLVAVALIQRKRRPAEVDRDVSSEYLKGHGRRKFFFYGEKYQERKIVIT